MADEAKKIFLIEEDQFFSSLLKNRFAKAGFAMDVVRDGAEALQRLQTEKPSIILMEIILPGLSGFEILEAMKAKPDSYPRVPVVVLTKLTQESDVEKAKKLGVAEYLIKANISIDEVVNKVMALVQK